MAIQVETKPSNPISRIGFSGTSLRHFYRLPLFWRFQIPGWLAFIVFTFPLKWVVFEDIPGSVMVSAYRDGLGFFVTLGMREIYRRTSAGSSNLVRLATIVTLTSLLGGLPKDLFVRPSRSLIVNLEKIERVSLSSRDEMDVKITGFSSTVPLGRKAALALRRAISQPNLL